MKKAIIILAVILTSGLTALSINKSENKAKAGIEKANVATKSLGANTDNMAVAD